MKLIVIALCSLLGIASTSFSMRVKMPDEKTLRGNLNQVFYYFDEKTHIIKQLAAREKTALEISVIVEQSFADFGNYLKNPQLFQKVLSLKPELYENLLKHSPEALRDLEKIGVYSPIK